MILNTGAAFAAGLGECWEVCFAILQQLLAHQGFDSYCPTVVPDQRFCDLRGFALREPAGADALMIRRETAQIAKGMPSSRAHWQEKYNEANDVSPPSSTAANNVRLTCADSTLDVYDQ